MPELARMAYVSGAVDSLMIFARDAEAANTSVHYYNCLRRVGMTNGQLTENVREYGKGRPELHGGTVQAVLINYLNCAVWTNKG